MSNGDDKILEPRLVCPHKDKVNAIESTLKDVVENHLPHITVDIATIKAKLGNHDKLLYIIIATIISTALLMVTVTALK